MPSAIKHFCSYPRCKAIAERGTYCDEHRPKDTRPCFSKRGYDAKWQKLRAVKLAETPFCEGDQGIDCGRLANQVHHINKVAETGEVIVPLEELVSQCPSCHSKKTRRGL